MELIVFIGAPGAGKSTYYQQHLFHTHLRINLDMLRTRRREAMLFEAALRAGQRLVIDNTNPTLADRQRYLPAARAQGFSATAIYFDTPREQLLVNNSLRQGKARLPDKAVLTVFRALQPPCFDEGFARIIHLRWTGTSHVVIADQTPPE